MKKTGFKRMLSLLTVLAVFFAFMPASYAVTGTATIASSQAITTVKGTPFGASATFTITLTDDTFKDVDNSTNKDVTAWVKNADGDAVIQGVTFEVTQLESSNKKATIKVVGNATDVLAETTLKVTVPSAKHTASDGDIVATGDVKISVTEPAPAAKATIANVTIDGTKDANLTAKEVTITLTNAKFVQIAAEDNVAYWIENLPAGLTAKIKAQVSDGATSATIKIEGTPTAVKEEPIEIIIPQAKLKNGAAELAAEENANAKFAITAAAQQAQYALEISGDASFADVKEGYDQQIEKQYTIKNTGSAKLTDIAVTIDNSAEFTLNPPAVVGNNELNSNDTTDFGLVPKENLAKGEHKVKITVKATEIPAGVTKDVTFKVLDKNAPAQPPAQPQSNGSGRKAEPNAKSNAAAPAPVAPAAPEKPAVTVKNEAAKSVVTYVTNQAQADLIDKLVENKPVTEKKEALKALTDTTKMQMAQAVLPKFTDILQGQWYSNDVAVMTTLGLVNGTSENIFSPVKNVTGKEMIAMLVRSMGVEAKGTAEDWFAGYAPKYSELKLNDGASFDISKDLTRAEVAQLMYNYVKAAEKTMPKVDMSVLDKISDANTIPAEYKEAVAYMYQKGLLKGYGDGNFGAGAMLTRQEAVVILSRLLAM